MRRTTALRSICFGGLASAELGRFDVKHGRAIERIKSTYAQLIPMYGQDFNFRDANRIRALWTAQRKDAAFRAAGVTLWVLKQYKTLGTVQVKDDQSVLARRQANQAITQRGIEDDARLRSLYLIRSHRLIEFIVDVADGNIDDWFLHRRAR